ncbi:MAG TPA: YceI family protein [Casimicrobiaceae bacterium]|nr:YceI family protein [Casimicrobiaceae bacterium]
MSVCTVTAASLAALAILLAGPAAAEERYVLDTVHSQPGFETRHLGFSTQHGSFQRASGTVTLDRAAKKGSVEVTIDATSVRTHDTRLDAIVKGPRFFDVERYPTITYQSSDVIFDGDRVVGVDGALTMLGVTRPVKLTVTDFGCGPQPFNKRPMCGGDATATIKRSEWGMTANLPLAPADEVKLEIPFEAYRE